MSTYSPDETALGVCRARYDSAYFVITDPLGLIVYGEHGGGHAYTAWEFLNRSRHTAKWKTAGVLRALRQAFREDSVNCRDDDAIELLNGAPSRSRVAAFLRGARARDFVHHGANTF